MQSGLRPVQRCKSISRGRGRGWGRNTTPAPESAHSHLRISYPKPGTRSPECFPTPAPTPIPTPNLNPTFALLHAAPPHLHLCTAYGRPRQALPLYSILHTLFSSGPRALRSSSPPTVSLWLPASPATRHLGLPPATRSFLCLRPTGQPINGSTSCRSGQPSLWASVPLTIALRSLPCLMKAWISSAN